MARPLLLDLFCGGGGAAVGYHRAGFDVIGVDNKPQPDYPFEFHQTDALEFLDRFWGAKPFDAIHASPPCQHHTALAKGNNANQHAHPELISPTRELLKATGLPYVIENALTAPLIAPIVLCGDMFGLNVIRHRKFESNLLLWAPEHQPHRGRVMGWRHGVRYEGVYVAMYGNGGGKGSLAEWQAASGIDWITTKKCLKEAIPPAYTEFVGGQLMDAVKGAHRAASA